MPKLHTRVRTVRLVRLLRAIGPIARRRGRMPRQNQPDGVRLDYYQTLQRLSVRPAIDALHQETPLLMHLLSTAYRVSGRHDVDERSRARELVERAATRGTVSDRVAAEVARDAAQQTVGYQRGQLDRQVRWSLGVSYDAIEKPTRDRIPLFVSANVELIRSIPDRFYDSVGKSVAQAFAESWSVDRLAQEIAQRGEVAESNARRIAIDQIGKLFSQVNQDRQESLGIDKYIWRTQKDDRVRSYHADLEGVRGSWFDDGVEGADVDGEPAHPGEPIGCRCYAEPVFSFLQESVDRDADEGDDEDIDQDADIEEG